MKGASSSVTVADLLLRTTPTIATSGRSLAPKANRTPRGFLAARRRRAIDSLTTATFGAAALSVQAISRPAMSGIPSVEK